jgi:hypothetical protein
VLAQALRGAGTDCTTFESAGCSHFDVILDPADPVSDLGRRTLGLIG